MNIRRMLVALAIVLSLATTLRPSVAVSQTTRLYQQMTQTERAAFVAEQARAVARRMSGNDYQFTTAYENEIQKAVDFYVRRIGNNRGELPGTGDTRFIFERGQTTAPTLIRIFKARNVSPLIGLYLPMVESEYVNIQQPNSHGAVGMFQFVPQTGEHYGLKPDELVDVERSADAAARYVADSLDKFSRDRMKEALALLAYNRGANKVEHDVATVVNQQNSACSICALSEGRDKLDAAFRNESVYYVPRFFAAAIIGENPQAFGLQMPALSSLEPKP